MITILIIILVVCLVGGFGTSFAGWGGGTYRTHGYGGIGVGVVLAIIVIFLLLQHSGP